MFDKFLKFNSFKKNQIKSQVQAPVENPNLTKLISKFDDLEKELILRGESSSKNTYIQHPLKSLQAGSAKITYIVAKEHLKNRNSEIENIATQLQNILMQFQNNFSASTEIILQTQDQSRSILAIMKLLKLADVEQSDSQLIELLKEWKLTDRKNKAQISIERDLQGKIVAATLIISFPKSIDNGGMR